MSSARMQPITDLQDNMVKSLRDIGYKHAFSLFEQNIKTDSELNKTLKRIIVNIVESGTFMQEFWLNDLKDSTMQRLYSIGAVSEDMVPQYPICEPRDIIASFCIYIKRLEFIGILSTTELYEGIKIIEDIEGPFGDPLYNYVTRISSHYNYHPEKKTELACLDKF